MLTFKELWPLFLEQKRLYIHDDDADEADIGEVWLFFPIIISYHIFKGSFKMNHPLTMLRSRAEVPLILRSFSCAFLMQPFLIYFEPEPSIAFYSFIP